MPLVLCPNPACDVTFSRRPYEMRLNQHVFCSRACRTAVMGRSVEERFWSKVLKTDTCWIWQGSRSRGYGNFRLNGKVERAHCLSFAWANGPIPPGMWVLHNCPGGDNPSCINPAHLWLGTHDENLLDASRKGRLRGSAGKLRGENHPKSKLQRADIPIIRLLEGNMIAREVAQAFHVRPSTIVNVWIGQNWSHVV